MHLLHFHRLHLEHIMKDVAARITAGVQVHLSDDHFWFHKPHLVLHLIHFILFQNAFQTAFFFWLWVTYSFRSCIMGKVSFLVPRLIFGVIIQVLCSFSTLPIYAIVTQEPVPPLNSSSEHQSPNQPWMDDPFESMDLLKDQGIPVLITWSLGGSEVVVQGSWDNWTSRKALIRSGKDHVILLVLPSGLYQYKFIVDAEWSYIPDLPCVPDEMGCVNNLLEVQDYVPENIGNVKYFETPPSPDSSYNRPLQVVEDYSKEPPLEPPHLELMVLGLQEAPKVPLRPHHVILNHLFIEKDVEIQSLVSLGLTHRFREKYVTVVLYKPARW